VAFKKTFFLLLLMLLSIYYLWTFLVSACLVRLKESTSNVGVCIKQDYTFEKARPKIE